mgnify:CR=1 FL=1
MAAILVACGEQKPAKDSLLGAFEKRELLWEDFPPIVWEIPNLKKNCFKKEL